MRFRLLFFFLFFFLSLFLCSLFSTFAARVHCSLLQFSFLCFPVLCALSLLFMALDSVISLLSWHFHYKITGLLECIIAIHSNRFQRFVVFFVCAHFIPSASCRFSFGQDTYDSSCNQPNTTSGKTHDMYISNCIAY